MPRRTAQEAQETIDSITAVAFKHFGEYGYADTSLEAVVQEAGVTRGALYHHFAGKQGLFEAVVAQVQRAIAAQTADAAQQSATPWEGFVVGCHAWLEAASDPVRQKILVIEAPAVLGWERWLQLDAEGGASLLRAGLEELSAAGMIQDVSPEALFHLLNGAMNQAVVWIAQADDPALALRQAQATLEQLLNGIVQRS